MTVDLKQYKKIIVIGHSNTEGFGYPRYREFSWVRLLSQYLGNNTRVVNIAHNGSRVTDWLQGGQYYQRVDENVDGSGAAIIHLTEAEALCPIPNSSPIAYTSPEDHLINATALVSLLQSRGVQDVIWIGPTAIYADAVVHQRLQDLDESLAIGLTASVYLRPYPDMLSIRGGLETVMPLYDLVESGNSNAWHLSEWGHSLLYNLLRRDVLPT